MGTLIIPYLAIVFLVLAVLSSVLGVKLRARRIRNAHLETICAQWLKRLNDEAKPLEDKIGGDPFHRTPNKHLKSRGNQGSWIISCPLIKRYQHLGFHVDAEMIIHVYSLAPDKDGAVETIFVSLTEPVKKWWSSRYRHTVFPILMDKLHAKELGITLTPSLGNTLVPKEISS